MPIYQGPVVHGILVYTVPVNLIDVLVPYGFIVLLGKAHTLVSGLLNSIWKGG